MPSAVSNSWHEEEGQGWLWTPSSGLPASLSQPVRLLCLCFQPWLRPHSHIPSGSSRGEVCHSLGAPGLPHRGPVHVAFIPSSRTLILPTPLYQLFFTSAQISVSPTLSWVFHLLLAMLMFVLTPLHWSSWSLDQNQQQACTHHLLTHAHSWLCYLSRTTHITYADMHSWLCAHKTLFIDSG